MLSEADRQVVIGAAKSAGKVQLQHYKQARNIKMKSHELGLISDVDLECEDLIFSLLKERFPNHNFVKEETDDVDAGSPYTWYIDPLDGTSNYLHGINLFGVSIGLAHAGKPVFGVVYLPISDQLFIGEHGRGATCNAKRLKVSDNAILKNSLIYVGSDINRYKKESLALLDRIIDHIFRLRMIGAAVIDLMQVAQGQGDCTLFLHIHPWDVVASVVIVREAGGTVTDFAGKEWVVGSDNGFLASNGKVDGELIEILRKHC